MSRKPSQGSAQPKQDSYASSRKGGPQGIAAQIEATLAEMFPDLPDHEVRALAAQLASEYAQEQQSVAREASRGPAQGAMDPGRDWKWDGNQKVYTDTPEYQSRRAAGAAGRRASEDDASRSRERYQRQMMKANIGLAKQKDAKPGNFGEVVSAYDKMQADRKRAAQQFTEYTRGRPGASPPSMAQPKEPPAQGTPYGVPSQQEMYWRLVDGGMDPAQASGQVGRAFRHAPQ